MFFLYLTALIPFFTGGYLYYKYNQIHWKEWLIMGGASFVLAVVFHTCIFSSMTDDVETWSGEITKSTFYPKWIEEYQERHEETYYTGSGEDRKEHTRVWYTTEHRTHYEHWEADTSLGTSHSIKQQEHEEICSKFGGFEKVKEHKPGFDSGDPYIYVAKNKTKYVFPATCKKHFENRVKASQNLFSFGKVPESVNVFDYPYNGNWRISDRLMGTAKRYFNVLEFERLNSYLGPTKHANLIIIGMPDNALPEIAEHQRAKFVGGRKNDLVIVFGPVLQGKASWCVVFGWTENELVKRNLETLFINNKLSTDLLEEIKLEVVKNFEPKDWSKFDYLTVEPPTWALILYFIVVCLCEVGIVFWAFKNDIHSNFTKEVNDGKVFYNRY